MVAAHSARQATSSGQGTTYGHDGGATFLHAAAAGSRVWGFHTSTTVAAPRSQGIGSDLLVLPPGLPRNMAIVPRVPEIAVTASRTVEHALAMRALATRPSVTAFRLVRRSIWYVDMLRTRIAAPLAAEMRSGYSVVPHTFSQPFACLPHAAASCALPSTAWCGVSAFRFACKLQLWSWCLEAIRTMSRHCLPALACKGACL